MTGEAPHPTVVIDGHCLRRGSRVRLRPRQRADIFDVALRDQIAVVDAIEEDLEGTVHVAVTLEADPGAMGDLVLSELSLAAAEAVEAHGARLVVSGRKPKP